MSRRQIAKKDRNIKVANKSFENVAEFTYFGMTLKNQNMIAGEIKNTFNSGDSCYHSVQNSLFFCLLPEVVKKCNFTCPFVSDIKEKALKVIENRALMRIFGPNRDEIIEGWRQVHLSVYLPTYLWIYRLLWYLGRFSVS
jgi:hypothetical protein